MLYISRVHASISHPSNKIYMPILVRYHKSTTYETFYFCLESEHELILTRGGSTVRVVQDTNKRDQIRSTTDYSSGCVINQIWVDTNCK